MVHIAVVVVVLVVVVVVGNRKTNINLTIIDMDIALLRCFVLDRTNFSSESAPKKVTHKCDKHHQYP